MKLSREDRVLVENTLVWTAGLVISIATWACLIWAIVSFLR